MNARGRQSRLGDPSLVGSSPACPGHGNSIHELCQGWSRVATPAPNLRLECEAKSRRCWPHLSRGAPTQAYGQYQKPGSDPRVSFSRVMSFARGPAAIERKGLKYFLGSPQRPPAFLPDPVSGRCDLAHLSVRADRKRPVRKWNGNEPDYSQTNSNRSRESGGHFHTGR